MTTITDYELQRWIEQYSNTKRHCWLNPEQLSYNGKEGSVVRPITDTILNTDDPDVLRLKKNYFLSPTFHRMTLEEKKRIVEEYGVTERLKEELLIFPRFVEVFS